MRIHSVPNQCDLVAKTQSCFIVTVHPPLELKPIIKMHRGNPMEVKKVIIQLSNRNWISLPTKLSAHCINPILDFPKSVLSFRQNICEWHPGHKSCVSIRTVCILDEPESTYRFVRKLTLDPRWVMMRTRVPRSID